MKKTWRHLRAARGPKLCPGGGEEDFDKDPSISEVGRPERGPRHWHKEHTAQSALTRRRRSRKGGLISISNHTVAFLATPLTLAVGRQEPGWTSAELARQSRATKG